MKILVFGAGFLGRRIAQHFGCSLSKSDITDEQELAEELNSAFGASSPDVVINAAGKTGRPNVDWCETHQEETYLSNVVGPLRLAEAVACHCDAQLIHLGSGCIFYGDRRDPDDGFSLDPSGWREDDFANPVSYYSKTKYAADLVLAGLPDVAIVRLRMPIDSVPGPRNTITKLASYPNVIDVANSVTVVDDLLTVLEAVIEKQATGIFHAANPGGISHRRILEIYREEVDPAHRCTFIPDDQLVGLGLASKPRSSCILSSARLDELGVKLRPAEVAVRHALRGYRKALG